MLDWLNKDKSSSPDKPSAEDAAKLSQKEAVIRVIGDRASGKTTYMAALARWPNATANSPVQDVEPLNEDGEELVKLARDILEQGLELEPTPLKANILDVKDYSLSITLKDQQSLFRSRLRSNPELLTLNINCKDYAGEFFYDLQSQRQDPKLDDYLNDCVRATGIMLLLDGTSRRDARYADGIKQFLTKLKRPSVELAELDHPPQKRRVALVLTKCEQSELWIRRNQADFLSKARFPKTYRVLKSWQEMEEISVECFTTSAFGMLGNRANAERTIRNQGGVKSFIKVPQRWRPFGLVSPIYWLCTGNRYKQLDED